MTAAVIVPWQNDGADDGREVAWEHLKPLWPWPVFEGACGEGPWNKALAVDDALSRLPDDVGVLIIADADVLPADFDLIGDAITWHAGARGRGWSYPAGQLRRLTPEATWGVIGGGMDPAEGRCVERYRCVPAGGLVVIRRDDYEAAPLDPRFTGWGQRDEAWCRAMRSVLGKEIRGNMPLYHLHHTPQERLSRRIGSTANAALHRRYCAASARRKDMISLLDEFRTPPAS